MVGQRPSGGRKRKRHSGALSDKDRAEIEAHLTSHPPRLKPERGGKTPNARPRSLANLAKAGQVPVDATLDLHGRTLEQAWRAVETLLGKSVSRQHLYLRVITGKGDRGEGGEGVLVREIPERLRRDDRVAEVVRAVRPKDGGAGAWFVRLRRQL